VAPDLTRVATYERTVAASLTRVWENVLDWEHLPWLHRTTFSSVRLLRDDPDGWRAMIGIGPRGDEAEVDVRLDRERRRYLTTTVGGVGAGTEILTRLTLLDTGTRVEVEFAVPGVAPEHAPHVGAAYVRTYERLWNEDEDMMVQRQTILDRRRGAAAEPMALGPIDLLRDRLPLVVGDFRVVDVGGTLVAHAITCPHRGGPLGETAIDDGCVVCPWHGYRFDVRSGTGSAARLRLPRAHVTVDAMTGEAYLSTAREPAGAPGR
jgi:nitrite reductase/ring-hydroxylating ferredoxin subunit